MHLRRHDLWEAPLLKRHTQLGSGAENGAQHNCASLQIQDLEGVVQLCFGTLYQRTKELDHVAYKVRCKFLQHNGDTAWSIQVACSRPS